MTREECIEAVKSPGKFEGEAPYVPYFWEAYLNGCADDETEEDDVNVLSFNVDASDLELFPELGEKRTVRLFERSDGFVIEI